MAAFNLTSICLGFILITFIADGIQIQLSKHQETLNSETFGQHSAIEDDLEGLIQGDLSRHTDFVPGEAPSKFIELNRKEVKSRGSWCLDGSYPGFLFKQNWTSKKWLILLQGGGWCNEEEECAYRTTSDPEKSKPTAHMSLANYSEFRDYNHVTFWYCDAGLYSGDRDDPVTVKFPTQNITMFFRGKRIVDHILDTLKKDKFGLKGATEVLFSGGSAGGLATYRIADYVGEKMPKSVKKFRAVPQAGWWSSAGGVQKETEDTQLSAKHSSRAAMNYSYHMHNMTTEMSPKACLSDFNESERFMCMYADISYERSETPMFPLQVMDMFVAMQNDTTSEEARHDSYCVLKTLQDWACTSKGIKRLNNHLTSIVDFLKGTKKFKRNGEGFFLSTCSFHAFYGFEELWNYAIDGVTMADAVLTWWNSDNSKPKSYLPCQMQTTAPYQCEDSCNFAGSGMQFSTPPPNDNKGKR